MDFDSKRAVWTAKLRQQFRNLCSEADAIIPQEQVEYVRDQFLTVGENLKHFYTELVEDAFPTLVADFLDSNRLTSPKHEENTGSPSHRMSNTPMLMSDFLELDGPTSPKQEANTGSPSHRMLNTPMLGADVLELDGPLSPKQEGNTGSPSHRMSNVPMRMADFLELDGPTSPKHEEISSLTSSSHLLPTEPDFSCTDNGSNGILPETNLVLEVEENKLPGDEVTSSASSCRTETTHSIDSAQSGDESPNEVQDVKLATVSDPVSDMSECISDGESPERQLDDRGKEAVQPSGIQKLDEGLVLVDSGEVCSDSSKKGRRSLYQKVLKKLLVKKEPSEAAVKVIDAEINIKERERLGEEGFSDSEWEII